VVQTIDQSPWTLERPRCRNWQVLSQFDLAEDRFNDLLFQTVGTLEAPGFQLLSHRLRPWAATLSASSVGLAVP